MIVALLLSTGVQAVAYVAPTPSISSDGRFVAFDSAATDLVTGDTNGVTDIFVRDSEAGTTRRISKSTTGVQGNGSSNGPSVSSDGRFVAFYSSASNLVTGDTNGRRDIFVRDRPNMTTTRISKSTAGVQGNGDSYAPSVSSDGRFVAFDSYASNLVAGDTNAVSDIFVRDRQAGTTTRISKSTAGVQGNAYSYDPSISADGRFVVFASDATNLVPGDTNGVRDIFVRDRQTGTTSRISKSTTGAQGNLSSYGPSVSSDGRYVAFFSHASNLVPGDTNAMPDIFVRDRQAGTITRISKSTAGVQGNEYSISPSISADGRYVAFYSLASNLVPGDTNSAGDIFVRDRQTGTTTRVSKSTAGVQGNGYSSDSRIAAAGRYVAFYSLASNLVTGDTNSVGDIFVRDRQLGETYLISQAGV